MKRAILIVLIVIIVLAVFTFTVLNTQSVEIDLGFVKINASVAVACAVTFAIGWLFGVLCMGLYTLRIVNERRQLRRALKVSQSEVTGLRKLPLTDAD